MFDASKIKLELPGMEERTPIASTDKHDVTPRLDDKTDAKPTETKQECLTPDKTPSNAKVVCENKRKERDGSPGDENREKRPKLEQTPASVASDIGSSSFTSLEPLVEAGAVVSVAAGASGARS